MISRVHIENFKSLKDVTVDLGRFTVLVGPNGCGKSGVLQAMMFAWHAELDGDGWKSIVTEPSAPLVFQMYEEGGLSFRFEADPTRAGSTTGERNIFDQEGNTWDVMSQGWRRLTERPVPSAPLAREEQEKFRSELLHPQADKLTSPSLPSAHETPKLAPDGDNLASVLSYIAGYDADAFAAISNDLSIVVPGVRRVRVVPEQIEISEWEVTVLDGEKVRRRIRRKTQGHGFLLEFTDARRVPSQLVSEGTAVALGILTLLHTPDRPRLLLIDDIDRGLHIEAQANLVKILRKIMDLDPELQIVCTTHSPYLVSMCKPSEVRVLALDEQRHTRVQPLTAHPEFEKWKFGTQTGELWAALGHAWVAMPEAPKS